MNFKRLNTPGSILGMAARVQMKGDAACAAVALILVRQIKLTLSMPGTGKYRTKGRKVVGRRGRGGRMAYRTSLAGASRASAPGRPPAVDTGALRNSIATERVALRSHRVGTNNEYAAPLEFGANLRNGGTIAPRPFMRPAIAAVEQEMGIVFAATLKSGLPLVP